MLKNDTGLLNQRQKNLLQSMVNSMNISLLLRDPSAPKSYRERHLDIVYTCSGWHFKRGTISIQKVNILQRVISLSTFWSREIISLLQQTVSLLALCPWGRSYLYQGFSLCKTSLKIVQKEKLSVPLLPRYAKLWKTY